MNKKKKWIIIIAAIIVILIVLIVVAVRAYQDYDSRHGTCGNNLTWEYDGDGTLVISGYGKMKNYDPDIMPDFFWRGINLIVIKEGVTSIGDNAFRWQFNMNEIIIPDTVTSIGDLAFRDCDNLKEINIPDSVTSIGSGAFLFCDGLEEITIPASVTSIGDAAFEDCTRLRNIKFEGDCPFYDLNGILANKSVFHGINATIYYPAGDSNWERCTQESLGGNIIWVPYQ